VFRFSVTLRLLALSNIKYQLSSPGFSPPRRRPWSPLVGSSTLMTSAPIHASISVHDGPASNCVRSSTRTPASALSMATPPLSAACDSLRYGTPVLALLQAFQAWVQGIAQGIAQRFPPC